MFTELYSTAKCTIEVVKSFRFFPSTPFLSGGRRTYTEKGSLKSEREPVWISTMEEIYGLFVDS